jgi:predicted RNA-binding protein YlqC (UPF0109 family)
MQDDERDSADQFELDIEDDADDVDLAVHDDAPASAAAAGAQPAENGAAKVELSGPAGDLVRFVEYMASNLVDDPSTLEIRPENFGAAIHIKLIVPEEEMGKVIGRQGRIARSMRTLLTIAAARKGLRASLDIDS